jgi:hypothetical protein
MGPPLLFTQHLFITTAFACQHTGKRMIKVLQAHRAFLLFLPHKKAGTRAGM